MSLKEIYNTDNASYIFELLENEMDIEVPPAVLIPVLQNRIISVDFDDTYEIYVKCVTREKIFDTIKIKPVDIENSNLVYRWGLKGIERLDEEKRSNYKAIFHKLAKDMPERLIYNLVGHVPDKERYIFGNYLVRKNECNRVSNGLIKTDFEIKQEEDFFLSKYITCFRNQTEGIIILFSLLMSLNLSRMAQISNERPSFLLAIIGSTGNYKTSTVQATLNPYQDTSFSIASFEDTPASIVATLKQTRDMVSIVDDYYTNTDNDITSKLEKVIRLNGDKSSVGKKMSGSKILSDSSDTISVITGEQVPKVRVSSIPRMLIIEFKNAVDLDALTVLQNSQEEFRGALIKFIQYTLSDDSYSKKLIEKFVNHRNEMIQKEQPKWHGRYISMCCWFLAMYDVFCDFCEMKNISYDSIQNFPQEIRRYISRQSKRYLENDVVYIFLKALRRLIDENGIKAISDKEITSDTLHVDVIYNDDYYWIESRSVFDKIVVWCQRESIPFNVTKKELYNRLFDDNFLIKRNGKLTSEYRKGKFRQSTVCLARNNINRYNVEGGE